MTALNVYAIMNVVIVVIVIVMIVIVIVVTKLFHPHMHICKFTSLIQGQYK